MPGVQQKLSGSPSSTPDDIEDAIEAAGQDSPFPQQVENGSGPARKELIRRDGHDYSQSLRLAVQLFILALNLVIGVQFYLWVRWAELLQAIKIATEGNPVTITDAETGAAFLPESAQVVEGNGRHEETRTPDLYRVKKPTNGDSIT
jgi:hypothetical protein